MNKLTHFYGLKAIFNVLYQQIYRLFFLEKHGKLVIFLSTWFWSPKVIHGFLVCHLSHLCWIIRSELVPGILGKCAIFREEPHWKILFSFIVLCFGEYKIKEFLLCWYFSQKYEELPYQLMIALLGKDTCTPMFIAVLNSIASLGKQPRCPIKDEEIKKLWLYKIYIMQQ